MRLKGFLNVDLPPAAGVASGASRPDVEADIRALRCCPGLLREIRLHHVFEHFERAEALGLLLNWYDWLQDGGVLVIETPDFEGCVNDLHSRTMPERILIYRHLFGSQEAPWARHLDGWSEDHFRFTLEQLGYSIRKVERSSSDPAELLKNVTVSAARLPNRPHRERLSRAQELLRLSMNGSGITEQRLYARWAQRLEEIAATSPESAQ